MGKTSAWALLIGRFLMALIFIVAGAGKIGSYGGTQEYMQAMGVPGAVLPLVILTELGGGLAICFGLKTKLVAILLAGFSQFCGPGSGDYVHEESGDGWRLSGACRIGSWRNQPGRKISKAMKFTPQSCPK